MPDNEAKRLEKLRYLYKNTVPPSQRAELTFEVWLEWNNRLAGSGADLSELQLEREHLRQSRQRENEEGEEVKKTPVEQDGLTSSIRLPSSLERNFAKKDIPFWAKSDGTLLVLMRNYEMSRRKAWETYKAVDMKWRSNQKVRTTKKQHSLIRKRLERFRKDGESLKQELIATGMTPEEVDAYFRDPTLKRLLYPTPQDSIYEKEPDVIQKLRTFADMRTLLEFVGREWSELTREEQLALKHVEEEALFLLARTRLREGRREVMERIPDHSPRDPSSRHLADFLGVTVDKSDTSE